MPASPSNKFQPATSLHQKWNSLTKFLRLHTFNTLYFFYKLYKKNSTSIFPSLFRGRLGWDPRTNHKPQNFFQRHPWIFHFLKTSLFLRVVSAGASQLTFLTKNPRFQRISSRFTPKPRSFYQKHPNLSYLFLFISLSIIGYGFFRLFQTDYTQAAWYNDAWAYRKPVIIDKDQVPGSSDHTNFPILVEITADDQLAEKAQTDGDDILFADAGGTKLDHEFESTYNNTTGAFKAWVKTSALFATGDTIIYMYYGNSNATSQENPPGVWDSSTSAVYHFSETSGQHLDSTANNNDSTSVTVTAQGSAQGKIEGATQFDNSDDVVVTSNSVSLSPTSEITVEGWIKMDEAFDNTDADIVGIVDKGDYKFYLNNNNGKAYWVVNANTAQALESLVPSQTLLSDIVQTMAVYNDGTGNALYVGGDFTDAGGDPNADYIAKWDGTSFSWIPGQGLSSTVRSLLVFNDGGGNTLFVGGVFTDAGGDADADFIAKWDGATFSWPTGQGLSSSVFAMTTFDDGGGEALYVGGSFTNAGGDADADGIAKWDGATFSWPTGQGISTVFAMTTFDDGGGEALYVGGSFLNGGGDADADRIAKWNGSAFSWPTGQGLSSSVLAMTTFDDGGGEALYVGGAFTDAGSDADADRIAKWDGATFSWPTGQELSGTVRALLVYNDGGGNALFVGGEFINAGADADADYLAKWNGSAFSWPTGQSITTTVYSLLAYDDGGGTALYVGGFFGDAGSDPDADRIAKWNGSAFSWPNAQSLNGTINVIATFDDGGGDALYVGGAFTDAGGDTDADYIAKWDGSAFTWPTGQNLNGNVNALRVFDDGGGDALYVGGAFTDAGGDTDADRIAKWNGSAFSWPTGQNLNSTVNTLHVFNDGGGDALYVGGGFTDAGADTDADYIAKWDGSAFSWPTGQTTGNVVNALTNFNDGGGDALYVGGFFSNAGADADADNIAKWDGSAFSWPTGQNLSSQVLALAVFNDGGGDALYAGGAFVNAGADADADKIAKWDGSAFSWPTGQTISSNVHALITYNDGNGDALYVGGGFINAGADFDADYIAKWDGSAFSWPTNFHLTNTVSALGIYDNGNGDDLYIGGAHSEKLSVFQAPYAKVTSTTNSWNQDTWYHFLGSYDGSQLRMYINGTLENSFSYAESIDNSSQSLNIGSSYTTGSTFNHILDELRIHTTARSTDWVATNYNLLNTTLSYGQEQTNQNAPSLYYKLDEAQGTTAQDSTRNDLSGTISGASWQDYSACLLYSCLHFDGSNDIITTNNTSVIDFNQLNNFTLSIWVYPLSDGEGDAGEIFEKGANNYLRITNQGSDRLVDLEAKIDLATDATVTITDGLQLNQWQHIVLTYADDGDDEITVYINAVEKGSSTNGVGSAATDGNNLLIGGSSDNNFHGRVDEFKLYPYVRSADQIKTDFIRGSSTSGSTATFGQENTDYLNKGLLMHLQLNETSANTCSGGQDSCDSSGSDNHGTWQGNTLPGTGYYGSGITLDGTDDYIEIVDIDF